MRTDGRTDMTKLIISFRNFAKAPKKSIKLLPPFELITSVWTNRVMIFNMGEKKKLREIKPPQNYLKWIKIYRSHSLKIDNKSVFMQFYKKKKC